MFADRTSDIALVALQRPPPSLESEAVTAVADALAAAGNTTRAERLCHEALLGPAWATAVTTLAGIRRGSSSWLRLFSELWVEQLRWSCVDR